MSQISGWYISLRYHWDLNVRLVFNFLFHIFGRLWGIDFMHKHWTISRLLETGYSYCSYSLTNKLFVCHSSTRSIGFDYIDLIFLVFCSVFSLYCLCQLNCCTANGKNVKLTVCKQSALAIPMEASTGFLLLSQR